MKDMSMKLKYMASIGVLCVMAIAAGACDHDESQPGGGHPPDNSENSQNNANGQSDSDVVIDPSRDIEELNILSVEGWLESVAVTWESRTNSSAYNVYYKGGAVSDYIKIDDQLVRNYGDYYRADIPGIAAGAYNIKVAPVIDGQEAEGAVRDTTALLHDRSGYAFHEGKVPGGYTMDGTPKPDARIIYVTDQNKDTITLVVNVEGKGDVQQTGLYNIINGHKKGKETRPLIIRLIGQIKTPAVTDKGDIVFDTGNAANTYITLEGVGNDATADGWGVRLKNASNIEISNIGFMNTASSEGDDVGLQQKNYHIWVHNCDLFYGKAGGDADQAKGDGAMDAKGSTYVTFSYNHFWDNGKTHLIGNKENGPDGTPGLLTLHHNWYDHSDSRHPRVRIHTVHVYNNYYDGVAKYGIGAAYGASIFAEGNYFRGTKKPVLISMQGSDVWDVASQSNKVANGTFSSEDGGVIKAYGNYFEDSLAGFRFVPYGASGYPNSTVDFDAYVTKSRNETVPSTVKTSQGEKTYNNFDTASGFYSYMADTADDALVAKIKAHAGRMGGGDFEWTFTTADDASSNVNARLRRALENYRTKLVSVQDIDDGSAVSPGGGGDSDGEESDAVLVSDAIVCHFTGRTPSNSALSITGNYSNSKGQATVNGATYTDCLKMESSTTVSFSITEAMTLTLYFASAETDKKVKIDGRSYTTDSNATATVSLEAGSHTIAKGDSINLFYILLSK
ncbi:MAG: hypothetical protein LBH85_09685 [Treponema sp.]|nr:hypothetical protein [Treponema sp.]